MILGFEGTTAQLIGNGRLMWQAREKRGSVPQLAQIYYLLMHYVNCANF